MNLADSPSSAPTGDPRPRPGRPTPPTGWIGPAAKAPVGLPDQAVTRKRPAEPGAREVAAPHLPQGSPLPEVAGYEVLGELGRGGMGIVFKARDVRLNRLVALKMIPAGPHAGPTQRARFLAEAEAVARLQHPNIVQIFDVGVSARPHDGPFSCPYLSLEFVEGGSLAQRLDGTPVPPRATAQLIETLARAVHHAHERGIIHRDLKPANILLQMGNGEWGMGNDEKDLSSIPHSPFPIPHCVKITDFGLAKQLDAGGDALTLSGTALGTPEYMAPEQALAGDVVGAAADVWALGVILYELLTGRRPFDEATPWLTMDAVLENEPVPVRRLQPRVPRDLETICVKCLRKEPGQRYATAAALADDCAAFLRGEPVRARRVGELESAWKWARRRPAVAGLLAALALLLPAGTGVSTYFAFEAEHRAADARIAQGNAEAKQREADNSRQEALQAKAAVEREGRQTRRQAAELLVAGGQTQAEAGNLDRGLHALLDALRLTPEGPETADFRLMIRRNLAAWGRETPALTRIFPQSSGRFVGSDSNTVVTWAGRDLFRWDVTTGQPIAPAKLSLPDPVAGVSADGTRVLTRLDQDGAARLRVWDALTGAAVGQPCPFPLRQYAPGITEHIAELGPDGRDLAVRSQENYGDWAPGWLQVWDVATGKPLTEPLPFTHSVDGYRLTRAKDGHGLLLVFRGTDRAQAHAEFRDLVTRKQVLPLPTLANSDLTLQPNDQTLTSVADDGTVCWWNPATGEPLREPWRPPGCHSAGAIGGDGVLLAAPCNDQRVRWYSLGTSRPYQPSIPLNPGHWRSVTTSPDGTRVLIEHSTDENVQVWQVGNLLPQAQAEVRPLLPRIAAPEPGGPPFREAAFSPDRRRVLLTGLGHVFDAYGDRYGRIVDTASGLPVGLPLRGGTTGTESGGISPAFSPDGKLVATCTHSLADPECYARVWDAVTGRPVTPPLRYLKYIHALAFSPDSRTLAVGTVGPILLWDVATAQARVLPQVGPVCRLTFSPNGRWLAAATRDGWKDSQAGVQFWEVATGRPVAPLVPFTDTPDCMAFLPDGRTLQTLHVPEGRLRRLDAATGKLLGREISFPNTGSGRLAILSPDGSRFLTGHSTAIAQQWDSRTGERVGPPMPHPSPVSLMAYTADGSALALAGLDGTVRLWDAVAFRPIGPPLPHTGTLLGLAFDPAGRTLVTTNSGGDTCSWPIPEPVPDNVALLETWLQATSGMRVEGGEVFLLSPGAWAEQGRKLQACWPEGVRPASPSGGLTAWHEARAREAAQDRNRAAELWHLDHLTGAQPEAWLPYVRRAASYSAAGDRELAAADYDLAAAHGGGTDLLNWYRHRARTWNLAGQDNAELWYLDRLLAVAKDDGRAYADRAEVHGRLARPAEREADQTKAVQAGAGRDYVLRVADEWAGKGRWREAADLCGRAAGQGVLTPDLGQPLVVLSLKLGDPDRYKSTCAVLLRGLRDGQAIDAGTSNDISWCCAVGPDALADYAPLVNLLEKALSSLPAEDRPMRHAVAGTLGAVCYRAGRYQDAVDRVSESLAGAEAVAQDWAFLAMAHHRLGHAAKAREYLARAQKAVPAEGTQPTWDRLEAGLLCAEAEALLQKSGR